MIAINNNRVPVGRRMLGGLAVFVLLSIFLATVFWGGMRLFSKNDSLTESSSQTAAADIDWEVINRLIAEAEYRFAWHDATKDISTPYVWALNRKQGWQVNVSQDGVQILPWQGDEWQWSLHLARYGYESTLAMVSESELLADKARAELRWSASLREWWDNRAEGLEQGFVLEQPPVEGDSGLVVLEMTPRTNLTGKMADGVITFVDADDETILQYGGLKVVDAQGRELASRLDLTSAGDIRILFDDTGAEYPVTVDPWVHQAQLTANDGHPTDNFGQNIAVSGDVVVITDSVAQIVYVFVKPAGGWANVTEIAKLTASDGEEKDYFGKRVDIDGDTVVATASNKTVNGNAAQGKAYVFVKPAAGWTDMTETAQLTASNGASWDMLGHFGVGISNDVIVVGGQEKKTVYVFEKPAGGWTNVTETAKLMPDDPEDHYSFGYSVAISGDTVAVGSMGYDRYRGAILVYEKPAGGWQDMTQTATLTSSDSTEYDYLGRSVAVDGDVIVGGAPKKDISGIDSAGAIYIFEKPGAGWADGTETARLIASDASANWKVGWDVAISGDIVIGGAVGAVIDGDPFEGAIYVFEKPTSGWVSSTEAAKLTISEGGDNDSLGEYIDIDGDTIVASSTDYKFYEGAGFVFVKNGNSWTSSTETAILQNSQQPGSACYFGRALAMEGDIMVVGAYAHDVQGAAYVFQTSAGDWSQAVQVAKLTASDGHDYAWFGHSVDISGDVIVIGSPQKHVGSNTDQGSVYVFVRPASGWTDAQEDAQIFAANGATGDNFGKSVAIDDDVIAVGAPYANVGGTDKRGEVYVIEKPATGWSGSLSTSLILTASDGAAGDWLGHAVDIEGETVAAGSPYKDSNNGAVYVFHRPSSGWQSMTETKKLIGERPHDYREVFGYSVAISGDYLAVGALESYVTSYGEGMVYLFRGVTSGWGTTDPPAPVARLTASNGRGGYYVGWSTDMDGDIVVSGSLYANNGENTSGSGSPGAVYVFVKPVDGWSDIQSTAILTTTEAIYLAESVNVDNGIIAVGEEYFNSSQGSVHVFNCTPPVTPANPTESIANDTDFSMTWTHNEENDQYQVWRAVDNPYFSPGDAGSQKMKTVQAQSNDFTFTDEEVIGTLSKQYYYVLQSGSYCNQFAPEVQRSAEFDFPLTPGQ